MSLRLIGVSGPIGSGKSTVARALAAEGWREIGLADYMKRWARDLFGFSDDHLFGPSDQRETPYPQWGGLTPRKVLQKMGTELGRECHPDVWVRKLLSTVTALAGGGFTYLPDEGLVFHEHWDLHPPPVGVIVPDCRFENEAAAIRAVGGEVWHLRGRGAWSKTHASEMGIAFRVGDVWVDNSGSVEETAAMVKELARGVKPCTLGVSA